MKWVTLRILITILGIALLVLELIFEVNGIVGFLLAAFGLFLIIIGLTFKGLVSLLANFFSFWYVIVKSSRLKTSLIKCNVYKFKM